jgi:NADP-dependent 3-hydroxy acid dehydrogenase YdfG
MVVGAASGMGRISARRLALGGAIVAAVDRDEEGLAATAEGYPGIVSLVADVTDREGLREVIEAVEEEMGPLDRVTHTAAIMPTSPLLTDPVERVQRVMAVNYFGLVNVASLVLPVMVERGRGDFIAYGSIAAEAVTPHMGAYCASKAAVSAYMEVLIHEIAGTGVRLHLTLPPITDTPLLDQARETSNPRSFQEAFARGLVADPSEIVDAVEAALEKGVTISRPHRMSRGLHVARRLAPGLLWKAIERSEDM